MKDKQDATIQAGHLRPPPSLFYDLSTPQLALSAGFSHEWRRTLLSDSTINQTLHLIGFYEPLDDWELIKADCPILEMKSTSISRCPGTRPTWPLAIFL